MNWSGVALTFYFDTHIAKAVATQLREKGVQVVRCEEVGMAEASDEEHLEYARNHQYVVVSQDEDFPVLHARWLAAGRDHSGIIKVLGHLQGQAQISTLVNELSFYDEAERGGALTAGEFKNTLVYL